MKLLSFPYCLIAVIALFGCNGVKEDCSNNNESEVEIEQQTVINHHEAVSANVLKTISCYIAKNDSLLNMDSDSSQGLYVVDFYKENQECFFLIGAAQYYKSNEIDGCIYIKNNLVVFYNSDTCENYSLINIEKLGRKEDIEGYPTESTYMDGSFEPKGNIYKIYNKDSLELVFSGYL